MRRTEQPVVIHLQRSLGGDAEAIDGWLRVEARNRGWSLKTEFYADALPHDQERMSQLSLGRMVRNLVASFDPSGFIVEYSKSRCIPEAAFGGVPVVFVDCDREFRSPKVGTVAIDDAAIARTAADELLGLGFPNCAYARWFTRPSWSVRREAAFREIVLKEGRTFQSVSCPVGEHDRIPAFVEWIRSLPKPCAVFAVNDAIARYVADACSVADVSVPFEVAVVGVDNDMRICEQGPVTITSVAVDSRQAASTACEMLAQMMKGRPGRVRTFGTAGVMRRASTRALRRRDSVVEKAAEYIRLHAAERIGVRETAAAVGCSPATLQRRFAAATGHAVGEEIANARFELAKRLLRSPDCVVSSVAHRCGYDSDSTLRYAFKSRLGVSPRGFATGER